MTFFFFFQQEGGEEAWQTALAASREAIVRDKKPRFVTVLDVDAPVDSSFTMEQLTACRYKGSFYADFDGALVEVIERVKEFAGKLQAQGVDLNSVSWFSTGGRGLHVEIPMECFVEKPAVKGYQFLPAIFKEMIFDVYVDTIDLRVYSARKGRMWRTPGVQRDNGLFKVPLTAAEVLSLDVKTYLELSAAPRHVTVAAPVFAHGLAVIFAKAQAKIDVAVKNKKSGEADKKILLRFGGKFPPSLEKIMQGEPTREGSGFHNIALQIAITANALGKTEAETTAACEGLFENHVSEGYRYNTPGKRKTELERLLRYTDGNPCYEFAKGAVKSICAKETDTSDLDGALESAGAAVAAATEEDHGLLGSVSMRENGVFVKDAEGIIKAISNISFEDVTVLKSLPVAHAPSEIWGFECVVKVKGVSKGRKLIECDTFSSKTKFNGFAMKVRGAMMGTDNQTFAIAQLLHDIAEKNMKVQYILRREGLDLVYNPDSKRHDLVYVGGGTVVWGRVGEGDPPYSFRSLQGPDGIMQSQLNNEKMLTGSDQEEDVIRAMLKMNDPSTLMKLIGWMTASFHRRQYHAATTFFPLCQVYGQAGASKTSTATLLAQMHYGEYQEVPAFGANAGTFFGLERPVIASSSIPVIIDEYKPRAIQDKKKLEAIRSMFRNVYKDVKCSRGGGDDSGGAKDYRVLTQEVLAAPVMFLGEAKETESAILERCVVVSMDKGGIAGRKAYFDKVLQNRDVLSRLGKTILMLTITKYMDDVKCAKFREHFAQYELEARKLMGEKAADRPVFATAVTLAGFDFFSEAVRSIFGTKLDEDLATVRGGAEIAEVASQTETVSVMAEASKAMDVLALISRTEEGFSQFKLTEGKEYAFSRQGSEPCIDLKMQECFVKYIAWSRSKGLAVHFDDFDQYCSGLTFYQPRNNLLCMDSPLVVPGRKEKIYRFNLRLLADEGVGQFHGQKGD